MREMFLQTPAEGLLGCCAAVRDMDLRDTHARISAPTLVIVGLKDPATPPAAGEESQRTIHGRRLGALAPPPPAGEEIQRRINGAKLAALDAAHISNVEQPQVYAYTVLRFLTS